MAKLTKAQEWLLSRLADGDRVLPAGGYEVHHSFYTGGRWYGAPASTFAACERRGWIKAQRITEAGRAALSQPGDGR